jgi:Cu2+-exporting ATPase
MAAPAISPPLAPASCHHCGLPVAGPGQEFCCSGCEAVHGLLTSQHLEDYYRLRGTRGTPVTDLHTDRRDTKWLEPMARRLSEARGHGRVVMDVQGLHCVACVWLIEKVFEREAGGGTVLVNPSLGRLELLVPPSFDLLGFVGRVERFGYLLGPALKEPAKASSDLLWRLGVCVAIAMNSMIFGIAIYAGLDRGPLFTLFTTLNMVLSATALAVGGTVFFRSAWRSTAAGLMHFDLPIAIGIALAFLGSVHSYFAQGSRAAYFDTLDVFIALMLAGRWLQERILERNRAWLLASDGTDGLLVRRLRGGRVETVRSAEIREGDAMLLAPGDLLPVEAVLDEDASFSLDWIRGESRPREYPAGDTVPAGAFLASAESHVARAAAAFDASSLRTLLATPKPRADGARQTAWWQSLTRYYVAGVLLLAAGGFGGWWVATNDLSRAMSVATSLLIVTCPCAFGIAAPLAYEMVQAGLRRQGLFIRASSFLDRAREVRRVVFDKTGTLTTGALVLRNPHAVDLLTSATRQALYDMVARSSHPKSAALLAAFGHELTIDPAARVRELAGRGMELEQDGRTWRLGDPRWACTTPPPKSLFDLALAVDGALACGFRTTESLRPGASNEIVALTRDGYDVSLLSGDSPSRVRAVAEACGIAPERARGGHDPQSKADFLDRHDAAHTLFVGDGVNDVMALDHALVSGTPAIDRPFVPARADFFFVTPGLAPIRLALRSARALAQVVRANLAIAFAYNAITVGLALAGRMSPLACAVLMPASSLTTIAVTIAALSPRSRLWKS